MWRRIRTVWFQHPLNVGTIHLSSYPAGGRVGSRHGPNTPIAWWCRLSLANARARRFAGKAVLSWHKDRSKQRTQELRDLSIASRLLMLLPKHQKGIRDPIGRV